MTGSSSHFFVMLFLSYILTDKKLQKHKQNIIEDFYICINKLQSVCGQICTLNCFMYNKIFGYVRKSFAPPKSKLAKRNFVQTSYEFSLHFWWKILIIKNEKNIFVCTSYVPLIMKVVKLTRFLFWDILKVWKSRK